IIRGAPPSRGIARRDDLPRHGLSMADQPPAAQRLYPGKIHKDRKNPIPEEREEQQEPGLTPCRMLLRQDVVVQRPGHKVAYFDECRLALKLLRRSDLLIQLPAHRVRIRERAPTGVVAV